MPEQKAAGKVEWLRTIDGPNTENHVTVDCNIDPGLVLA